MEEIVDDFYQRILADDSINGFFAHTDMEQMLCLRISELNENLLKCRYFPANKAYV